VFLWSAGAAFEREGGRYRIRARFRVPIEWSVADLREGLPPGPFDLLACRNLAFTYFDERLQREVLARLARSARPGAALIVGAHERPPGGAAALEPWPGAAGAWHFTRG
jgi:chemotaxis protein methyltransferase CheR